MTSTRIILISMLTFLLTLSFFNGTIIAQTPNSQYWVSVDPITSTSINYGTIDKNWTLPFQATWTYGENSGKAIENATITVEVKINDNITIENISQITNTTGYATFNYISQTPSILVFTPITLVTQDKIEYNTHLFEKEQNNLIGLQSKAITVYWDTFDSSLVSSDTNTQGTTRVSVNVTYFLVPEEGLVVSNTSSLEQIVFPKIAHGVNVTINGVKAEETLAFGVYSANFSTWLPTAYVFTEVSKDNWFPAQSGFSVSHKSNEVLWIPAIIISLVCVGVLLGVYLGVSKKTKRSTLFSSVNFPVIGGVLLAIVSFISLYWGVVGVVGTQFGFEWILLVILGLVSFGFGLVASIMAFKKRIQALVIFIVMLPMVTNLVVVAESLKVYQLTIPWFVLLSAFFISVVSGVLICNCDEQFLN